jgi:hypothetical protein
VADGDNAERGVIEVKGSVSGGKELARAFRELGAVPQKRVIMTASRSTGRVVHKDFHGITVRGPRGQDQSPASKQYGTAEDKLIVSRLRKALGVKVHFGSAFYMRFREFGTSHQPPRPRYRPLWDRNVQAYLKHYVDRLSRAINTEAKKIAGTYAKAKKSLGVKG